MTEEKKKQNTILKDTFEKNSSMMVKQETNLLEVATGFEIPNRYFAKTERGEDLKIEEISATFQRWILG